MSNFLIKKLSALSKYTREEEKAHTGSVGKGLKYQLYLKVDIWYDRVPVVVRAYSRRLRGKYNEFFEKKMVGMCK